MSNNLNAAGDGALGDSLGSLSNGELSELSKKKEFDGGLNATGESMVLGLSLRDKLIP
jgi:hypothetical protein